MTVLHVFVLGPVRAEVGGVDVKLGGPKQRALLASLVMQKGRPKEPGALVEELADATSGAQVPYDPLHALQARVSRLRRALPVDIELVPGGYRFDPATVRVDADDFVGAYEEGHRLLRVGEYEGAAACLQEGLSWWRGRAFADVPPLTGLQTHRARLEQLHEAAWSERIEADLARGLHSTLLPELMARVEEQPLSEARWVHLVKAQYCAGRAVEALATYSRARQTFVEQLGAEPGVELAELHQAVLEERPPESLVRTCAPTVEGGVPAERESRARPGRGARSELVGRGRELGLLEQCWARAQDGLQLVTVTGEPGVGKSRLGAEFVSRLRAQGALVLQGRCDEAVEVVHQPVMEMLRTDVESLEGDALVARLGPLPAELDRILPGLARRLPADLREPLQSDPATEQLRTFDAVAGWLATVSAHEPVCVLVDDLHWAGPETQLLLEHLVGSRRSLRLLMVATMRDRAHWPRTSDGGSTEGPRTAFVRQSDTVTHLPLAGLDESEVRRLLVTELGRMGAEDAVGEALAADVAAASGGNPLFVQELARHWATVAEGPRSSMALSAGLRQVIGERLATLESEVREGLRYAAAKGKVIDPTVLVELDGWTAPRVDAVLTSALDSGLVESVPGPGLAYVFCHDVVRTALYEELAPLERSRVHADVARAIERRHGDTAPEQFRALGHHWAQVPAEAARAAHFLKRAGDLSLEQRAPAAARGEYRASLAVLPPTSSVAERCDLMIALGSAEFQAGDPAYRVSLLAAARMAEAAGDAARLTAAVTANNRGWYSDTTELDRERIAVIEAALRACPVGDRISRAQLLGAWAVENVREPGRRDEALARSEESVALADEIGDPVLLGQMLEHHFAVVYSSFTDPWQCLTIAARLHDVAEWRADPGLQFNSAIVTAQASMMVADFGTVRDALDRAAGLGGSLHHPARSWMVHAWQAMCAATAGDLVRAEELANAAFEEGVATEQPDAFTWYAGQLFTFRMLDGRLGELIDAVEAEVTDNSGGIPGWRAAQALALAEVGRLAEAEEILDEFAEDGFRQLPKDMLWLNAMAYLTGVCEALGRADVAALLYEEMEPYEGLMGHNGTIDSGPVDLHLAAMARVSGNRSAAARHVKASIELCRDVGAPLWLARSREQERLLS